MDRRRGWIPLAVAAFVQALLFGYYVQQTMVRQPYWDMYSYVIRYLQLRRDGGWMGYLWEPHVQHRQPWMRLLMVFDAEALAGTAYPFIAFATACQLLTAWLVWRCVRADRPGPRGAILASLAVMLLLTAVAAVDCAIPMNGIYPQAVAFTVLAFVLFDAPDASHPHWRRAAAMASAMAAAFANAAALVAWPILVWSAWRTRAGRLWTGAVAVTGLVFGAVYVSGLPLAAEGEASLGGLVSGAELWSAAVYFFTYLGLPWTRASALETAGRMAGAVLFALSVWAVVRHGVLRPADRVERLAVACIAFTVATACLAAAGREADPSGVMVPVRYSVLVAPMHVGLLILVWPVMFGWRRVRAASIERGADLPGKVEYALAFALAGLLLTQQAASGQQAAAATRSMRAVLERFAAGEETDDMRSVVFVDLQQARRDFNAIRAAGLYLNAR